VKELWEIVTGLFGLFVTSPVRFLAFIVGVAVQQWKDGYRNGREV
jgi:hypothetical protein